MTRPPGKPTGETPDGDETPPKRKVRAVSYRYNLDRVLALRKTLREAVGHEFLGKTPTGDKFTRLVELVLTMLPPAVQFDTVADSLRHLAGTRVDDKLLDATCWRVAGNVRRLAQRRAVPPWHAQRLPEWVPVHVLSCRRERTAKGVTGARLTFSILAGTPAGLRTEAFWSIKFCRYLSAGLGFSKFHPRREMPFPYSQPEQFVGLRLYVRITPSHSGRQPGFEGVGFAANTKAWNKVTLGCRFRTLDGFECKMKAAPAALPCHRCPVGFTTCRAGTHRLDWETKPCPGCGRDEAYFDRDHTSETCIDCVVKAAYSSGR